MRKICFLLALLYTVSSHSQNDSIYLRIIKENQETIDRLNGELRETKEKLKNKELEYSGLLEKYAQKKDELKNVDQKRIKRERDSLERKIETLNDRIGNCEKMQKTNFEQFESSRKESYNNGYNDCLSDLSKRIDFSFNALVQNMSLTEIRHYKEFFKGNQFEKIRGNLVDAEIYLSAEELLNRRYDEDAIRKAIEAIEKTDGTKKLIKQLEDYNYRNDKLKKSIKAIVEKDKGKTAEQDNESQVIRKRSEIMEIICSFIYNSGFDFQENPYLGDIINRLIHDKYRNVNADVSKYLEML